MNSEGRSLRSLRQTCRIKIRLGDKEIICKLKFSHQRHDGLNECPLGKSVYLEPIGMINTDSAVLLEVLPRNDLQEISESIVSGLNSEQRIPKVELEIDGIDIALSAALVPAMVVSIPYVTMLTPESTASSQVIAPDAGSNFQSHVRELVKKGRCFYTVLNPYWEKKVYLWTSFPAK